MSKGNFARSCFCTAADNGDCGGSVMRRTKRAGGDD